MKAVCGSFRNVYLMGEVYDRVWIRLTGEVMRHWNFLFSLATFYCIHKTSLTSKGSLQHRNSGSVRRYECLRDCSGCPAFSMQLHRVLELIVRLLKVLLYNCNQTQRLTYPRKLANSWVEKMHFVSVTLMRRWSGFRYFLNTLMYHCESSRSIHVVLYKSLHC